MVIFGWELVILVSLGEMVFWSSIPGGLEITFFTLRTVSTYFSLWIKLNYTESSLEIKKNCVCYIWGRGVACP